MHVSDSHPPSFLYKSTLVSLHFKQQLLYIPRASDPTLPVLLIGSHAHSDLAPISAEAEAAPSTLHPLSLLAPLSLQTLVLLASRQFSLQAGIREHTGNPSSLSCFLHGSTHPL